MPFVIIDIAKLWRFHRLDLLQTDIFVNEMGFLGCFGCFFDFHTLGVFETPRV